MKKLTCLILSVICVLSFAMFLSACNDAEDSKAGLKVRNIDGVYIVVGYAEEKDDAGNVIDSLNVSTYKTADGVEHKIGAIKTGAFKGNANLKNITVDDSVTEIGAGAFANMTKLESLTLPFVGRKIVAYDSERLFGYIFGTTEYVGGYSATQYYNDSDSVTTYFPQTLQKVTVKNSFDAYSGDETPITGYDLPKYAFNGVISLSEINFDVKVVSIGDSAFLNCSGLKSFNLPDSVKVIGEKAFNKCLNLNGKFATAGTDGADFTYTSSSELTEIKNNAFLATKLTEIVLPSTVQTIGDFAFATEESDGTVTANGYSKITKVVMGDEVKTIGKYAFYKCDKLTDVTLGTKLEKISEGAFDKCTALTNVSLTGVFENNVEICAWAFYGCAKLEKFLSTTGVIFPAAIVNIGADAFNGCAKLTNPDFKSTATVTVGERAFANCSSVTGVVYAGAISMGENVFKGSPIGITFTYDSSSDSYFVTAYDSLAALSDVVIPSEYCGKKVTRVTTAVFANSTALNSIVLGDNIEVIEDNAFKSCTSLAKVTFGDGIKDIGQDVLLNTAFANDSGNYEGNILYVNTYAVKVLAATDYVIKDGTTLIANRLFVDRIMNSLTIASSVKYVCSQAFNSAVINEVKIDSEDVTKECVEITDCGRLIYGVTTAVYVKANIYEGNIGKAITDLGTPVKDGGYYKYSV